ncbi:hypothetical protein PV08_03387 [Exophiala spinifera]|uniref:Uncharacterized protein n=1 Tax=Exophiala spinifera TaxID=91928 RepID=A0A0D2BKK0_9EURO|nr:uncharacterized protein PV08_03387 [Exophiala spinifera]KIW19095.1 hypothetical protein PV08_03387 [Exophiala spinifera]
MTPSQLSLFNTLSYILASTLSESDSSTRRQQDTYDHLCSLFQSRCPQQNPAIYGNPNLRFFGSPVGVGAESVQLTRNATEGHILLQAGRAHGVTHGDLFFAYPFHQNEGGPKNLSSQPLRLCVVKVGGLTSMCEVFSQGPSQPEIQTGWKARWQKRMALQQYPILVLGSNELLNDWRTESARRTSLDIRYEDSGNITFSFYVTLSGHGYYEIRDQLHETIDKVPTIGNIGSGSGLEHILEAIEHLVWFKHVKSIVNQSPSANFKKSLSIRLTAPSDKDIDPTEMAEVRDGDRLVLEVKNLTSSALFLYIYHLDSSWQIQNIVGGAYMTIPAQDSDKNHLGVTQKVLKMSIPPEVKREGHGYCDDVVKVFVTARPVSFAYLETPKLGVSAKADPQGGIPVAVQDPSDTDESDWVTVNFQIRTIAK